WSDFFPSQYLALPSPQLPVQAPIVWRYSLNAPYPGDSWVLQPNSQHYQPYAHPEKSGLTRTSGFPANTRWRHPCGKFGTTQEKPEPRPASEPPPKQGQSLTLRAKAHPEA